MIKTQTINWKPFSEKHKKYIKSALKHKMCVAEGAIRSGKTIDHCIIAAAYLETCKDKIHLASGSSKPNAKLNIGVCNGFGLENLFRGRCRWGKYKDNDALFINTNTGEKIVIFVGGGKSDSYKKILGNSYGLWISTEINEHFISDDPRECFVSVAFGRQAAAEQPFILWDLNPCHPKHKVYTKYIDKYGDGFAGGYLYEHFTIFDNLSVTEQRRKELESQYEVGSVWYNRDILGKRCVAEGLVYKTFADNPHKYLTAKPDYDYIQIGIDFGGRKSNFAFVASGLKRDCSKLTALMSELHPAENVDPDDLYKLIFEFIDKVQRKYGKINAIYADNVEQTLINGIRIRIPCGSNIAVINSVKNKITNRIKALNALISSGKFFYTADCETLTDALSSAVYNPKKLNDERLDDHTSDIDTVDAFEYSWESEIEPYSWTK